MLSSQLLYASKLRVHSVGVALRAVMLLPGEGCKARRVGGLTVDLWWPQASVYS